MRVFLAPISVFSIRRQRFTDDDVRRQRAGAGRVIKLHARIAHPPPLLIMLKSARSCMPSGSSMKAITGSAILHRPGGRGSRQPPCPTVAVP